MNNKQGMFQSIARRKFYTNEELLSDVKMYSPCKNANIIGSGWTNNKEIGISISILCISSNTSESSRFILMRFIVTSTLVS